jgi:hypothetical protein
MGPSQASPLSIFFRTVSGYPPCLLVQDRLLVSARPLRQTPLFVHAQSQEPAISHPDILGLVLYRISTSSFGLLRRCAKMQTLLHM